MKKFVLYIGECDKPNIDVDQLINTLKYKGFDKDIEILTFKPTIDTAVINNLMAGSIMLVYFLDDIEHINITTHCTGFLHRCNDEKKFGICLYATNISVTFASPIDTIVKCIERACNIAKDIKLYNNN